MPTLTLFIIIAFSLSLESRMEVVVAVEGQEEYVLLACHAVREHYGTE